MTIEELFDLWAPPEARWSRWVKPVLFAHMDAEAMQPSTPPEPGDLSWVPPASQGAAIVVDLPGPRGVWLGLELARRGYRPVPLYNGTPGPRPRNHPGMLITNVDVWPIVRALVQAGAELAPLLASSRPAGGGDPFRSASGPGVLPADAPPAFLLDSSRRHAVPVGPGHIEEIFDNRSVTFPTDFPSARYLQASGIHGVLLVQERSTLPAADLAHTLRRWQDAGLAITCKDVATPAAPAPITVARPSWLGWVAYRALTLLGLERHALGGFGGLLPNSSSSS